RPPFFSNQLGGGPPVSPAPRVGGERGAAGGPFAGGKGFAVAPIPLAAGALAVSGAFFCSIFSPSGERGLVLFLGVSCGGWWGGGWGGGGGAWGAAMPVKIRAWGGFPTNKGRRAGLRASPPQEKTPPPFPPPILTYTFKNSSSALPPFFP